MTPLTAIFQSLWQIVLELGSLVVQLLIVAGQWSLLIAWVAWWLWGVNWKNAWPILARGAWVPLALLLIVSALVWSRITPSDLSLGVATVPNFWWHLGAIGLLAGVAFFCGWLQGLFHWTPAEVELNPPKLDPSHGHAHGHH